MYTCKHAFMCHRAWIITESTCTVLIIVYNGCICTCNDTYTYKHACHRAWIIMEFTCTDLIIVYNGCICTCKDTYTYTHMHTCATELGL